MALEIYSKAGALCIEQLSRLRHRGAFSVVTQTFAECCQAVEDCSIQEATCLRRQWYEVWKFPVTILLVKADYQ